ncbi:hypothetical protein D3C87_1646280 [compost metagenome]
MQGDPLWRDQQGGVVEEAAVNLSHAHHHRDVAFPGGALHRLHTRPVQGLGDFGELLRTGEPHQLGFRKHQQIGIRRAGSDGLQGTLQVISGIAIATGKLYEFNLHR